MTSDNDALDAKRITDYVERMSELQTLVQESGSQIGQIRQDAKSNGVNPEALTLIGLAKARNPRDGGVLLLNDIIRYARQAGMEIDADPQAFPDSDVRGKPSENWLEALQDDDVSKHSLNVTKLAGQLVLGGIIGVAFIWLLR
jgi:hypothetical protein